MTRLLDTAMTAAATDRLEISGGRTIGLTLQEIVVLMLQNGAGPRRAGSVMNLVVRRCEATLAARGELVGDRFPRC